MTKEDDLDKAEEYLEKARSWIDKANAIAMKYNIETDYLAGLTCSLDAAEGELEKGVIPSGED